jgi:YesN/AraC family two-component response regulator
MDVNMPKMNGLAAIQAMAQASPNTVCMICSSEKDSETLRTAMALGVREYLIKPFTIDELVDAVHRVAAQAIERKHTADASRTAEVELEKKLIQLTQAYLKMGRMDDEAAKVYVEWLTRPVVDPNLMVRLAEVFFARRDWHNLKLVCERMERLAPQAK